jgi:hypothetical protein
LGEATQIREGGSGWLAHLNFEVCDLPYYWRQSIPTNGTGYDRYGNLLTINSSQCFSSALVKK